LARHGLGPQSVCLEIAEAQPLGGRELERLTPFRARSFALAIDDFGTGHSGLHMLYETQPEQIKIDRFFIAGIAQDNKRKLFLSTIVDL
ncbi:EAL domain-containing protein, partial [Acinetobacter baumannii]